MKMRIRIRLRYFVKGASFCEPERRLIATTHNGMPIYQTISYYLPRPASCWQATFIRNLGDAYFVTQVAFDGVQDLATAVKLAFAERKRRWGI